MSRDLVNQWLAAVGEFHLDDSGTCVLESEQGISVLVEVPQEPGDKVFFLTPITTVDDSHSGELFRFVLELNLSLLHSGGLSFVLDSYSETLMLGLAKEIGALDETAFVNILTNITALAQEFAAQILAFIMENDGEGKPVAERDADFPSGVVRV